MDEQELREAKQQLYAKLCEARSLALDLRDNLRRNGMPCEDYRGMAMVLEGKVCEMRVVLEQEGIPLE